MALLDIQQKPKQSGGGGLLGSLVGGLIAAGGAAAAVPTGGASLAAIPAAAGIGSSLGGMIGEKVDPTTVKEPARISLMKRDPEVQLATLMDTRKEIAGSADLDQTQKDQASGVVNNAIDVMKRNLEIGRPRVNPGR